MLHSNSSNARDEFPTPHVRPQGSGIDQRTGQLGVRKGQESKVTFRRVKAISASGQKRASDATMRCPLYPEKRTSGELARDVR